MKCFKHSFNHRSAARGMNVVKTAVWSYAADAVQAAILAQCYVIRNKQDFDWKRFKQVPVGDAEISGTQAPMATTVQPRLRKPEPAPVPTQVAAYTDNGAGGVDFFDVKASSWCQPRNYGGAGNDAQPLSSPDYTGIELRILAAMSPEALTNAQKYVEKATQQAQEGRNRARRAKGMAAFNAMTAAELERAKAVLLAATGISADDPQASVHISASQQPDYIRLNMGGNAVQRTRHTNMLRAWLLRHGIKYETGSSPTRVLASDLLPLLGYATQIG